MNPLWAFFISSVVIPSSFQTCIATNLPFNSTLPANVVNSTSTPNISIIGDTSNIFTSCSASVASWLGFEKPIPDDFINNCRIATNLLQADINNYGSRALEFAPRWRRGTHGLEVIRTPIKYTAGTNFVCTITVVDMDIVPQRYVRPARYRITDVATFYDIRNALSEIWMHCLYGPPERQVGYAVTGLGNSLGVFVYGQHASIAFGMPRTPISMPLPAFAIGDGEQLDPSGRVLKDYLPTG